MVRGGSSNTPTLKTRYIVITKQRALFFYVGDKPFTTLVESQKHDLRTIVVNALPAPAEGDEEDYDLGVTKIVDLIINNSTSITDVLTTTPTSRAKARKTNGATKAKKPKLQPANVNKEVLVAK